MRLRKAALLGTGSWGLKCHEGLTTSGIDSLWSDPDTPLAVLLAELDPITCRHYHYYAAEYHQWQRVGRRIERVLLRRIEISPEQLAQLVTAAEERFPPPSGV